MRSRLRTWLPIGVLVVGVLVAAALTGGRDTGLPLDPDSTAANGTRALVETLRRLGSDVSVTAAAPGPETDAVLVLMDVLEDAQREALRDWVADGGTLVVADPFSDFSPPLRGIAANVIQGLPLLRRCDAESLRHVETVSAGLNAIALEPPDGATACFPAGNGHWLVIVEEGLGSVVSFGGADVLTNGRLLGGDNVLLAASLLAPRPGYTVAIMRPPRPGEGTATLTDLISPRVRLGFWQLVIAFVILALWRAVRLGRPIEEVQPVSVPGSELVVAHGNLLQHAGAHARAAAMIRYDLRRTLAERLGLPADTDDERLTAAAEQRAGLPRADVAAVLEGTHPEDDGALVEAAQASERLRHAVLQPVHTSSRGRG